MSIIYHEWGHGLDQHDGGDYDVPTEGYADVVGFLQTRDSCMFRGIFLPGTQGACGPAGNPCLRICDEPRPRLERPRVAHALNGHELGRSVLHRSRVRAPCGYEQHCEGQLVGETMWDLATRDLPATGMSLASSWQLVDRLWYTSRLGSGGNAYNCALPDTDGCSATSWFSKIARRGRR